MKGLKSVFFGMVVCGILLCAADAEACSIPVFHYALERWPPAPYQLLVFHRGPLGENDKKIVNWLVKCAEGMDVISNIEPRTFDLDGNVDPKVLEFWKKQTRAELPWMVLRYPQLYQAPGQLWSGRLTAENAKALLDSPVRREIGKRILGGQAAVWVLLESGDRKKDDAAARLLETELQRMKAELKAPELLAEDLMEGAEDAAEIKIDFSLLRLSRTDAAEKIFIEILLGTEPDLTDFGEPIVFPVFGQGRALCALVGKGINKQNIEEIGQFLVGPCSCIVKDENPGVDLLMSVDWTALPEGRWVKPPELPELTGIPHVAVSEGPWKSETKTYTGRYTLLETKISTLLVGGIVAVTLLGVLVIIIATVVIRRRKRSEEG